MFPVGGKPEGGGRGGEGGEGRLTERERSRGDEAGDSPDDRVALAFMQMKRSSLFLLFFVNPKRLSTSLLKSRNFMKFAFTHGTSATGLRVEYFSLRARDGK